MGEWQITSGVDVGISQLRENGIAPYDSGYTEIHAYAGALTPVGWSYDSGIFEGRAFATLGYVHTSGTPENFGSNRHRVRLNLGIKQNLLDWLFVAGSGRMGIGSDRLNFGDGTIPISGASLTLGAQIMAGIAVRLNQTVSMEPAFSVAYEHAVASPRKYEQVSYTPGLSVTFNWNDPPEPAPQFRIPTEQEIENASFEKRRKMVRMLDQVCAGKVRPADYNKEKGAYTCQETEINDLENKVCYALEGLPKGLLEDIQRDNEKYERLHPSKK
jgi:hypothetical protein